MLVLDMDHKFGKIQGGRFRSAKNFEAYLQLLEKYWNYCTFLQAKKIIMRKFLAQFFKKGKNHVKRRDEILNLQYQTKF